MTSYSRTFYEARTARGEPVGHPTGFASARALASAVGGGVWFHHADRLTHKDCPPEGPDPACHDGEDGARVSGGPVPFLR